MIARLRDEFRGLRLTPRGEAVRLLAGGLAMALACWAVLVFIIWCAS